MRTRFWLVLGLVALLATAMIAAGCGDDDDDDDGDGVGEELGLISEGTLTVGTDTPFPPFEIGQPPNISGYDIDVMNAVAEDLELTPEYIDTGFGTIFRDTAQGQFDVAAAASRSSRRSRPTSSTASPWRPTTTPCGRP